ncbi:MAG: hypothetical protein J6K04_05440 [Lachnospiraceae bacterium]|nr:hypothetical protein [Lachnospiraceae bacterium]
MDKEYKKKLRSFRRKLNVEAGIRAGSIGFTVGLAGMLVVLVYGRLAKQELWLLEAGVLAFGLFLITTLLAYFILFRPEKKEVLESIDALGLQERIITMEELRGEETVIAKKQRQDAKEQLAKLTTGNLQIKLYIKPLWCCLGLAVLVVLLAFLPFPKPEVDEQAEQNAMEQQLVDELITALRTCIDSSKVNEENKAELHEIVDALATSFLPEDTTLSRTAKIATASKRLDMLLAAGQSNLTIRKQKSDAEAAQEEIEAMEKEQKLLEATIKEMKNLMGTSIDVLNKVEGTFWTPGGPPSGTSYDVEPLPFEEPETEPQEGEEPVEGEQSGEGEEPPEGGEPLDGEGETGELNGAGTEEIFDPEQGIISYGAVYEEYYQEILKALTETELSGEMREMIEDYANSLE